MDLVQIQRRLTQYGFNTGGTTGRTTAATTAAVKAFQAAYAGPNGVLAVDGIPGPLTQAAMQYLPRLSPHFVVSELWCKHCRQVRVRRELLFAAEALRTAYGRPLYIGSAYRCAHHNARVGGASRSMHVYGAALDLTSQVDLGLVRRIRRFSGIGTRDGDRFVSHVDIRHLTGSLNATPRATVDNPALWRYGS